MLQVMLAVRRMSDFTAYILLVAHCFSAFNILDVKRPMITT